MYTFFFINPINIVISCNSVSTFNFKCASLTTYNTDNTLNTKPHPANSVKPIYIKHGMDECVDVYRESDSNRRCQFLGMFQVSTCGRTGLAAAPWIGPPNNPRETIRWKTASRLTWALLSRWPPASVPTLIPSSVADVGNNYYTFLQLHIP